MLPSSLGRAIGYEDDKPGAAPVVVLSHQFWQQRFGANPGVIGQKLVLNGESFTVVGVMPASFTATTTDVWLPAKINPWLLEQREARFLNGVAVVENDPSRTAVVRALTAPGAHVFKLQ